MTPEDFNQVAANLAAGFYTDAETLRRFVAEAVRLRAENERLQAGIVSWKNEEEYWIADNARLQAELDELRQQIENLAKINLTGKFEEE